MNTTQDHWREWVKALGNCSRRWRPLGYRNGWTYSNSGSFHPDGSDGLEKCSCDKCKKWDLADSLHAKYRKSMGFTD